MRIKSTTNDKGVVNVLVSFSRSHKYKYVDNRRSCLTIYDTYKIKDNEEKRKLLLYIKRNSPIIYYRSYHSLMNELVAHNILYNRNLFKSRTKDTDLEYNQSRLVALGYKIIVMLFKENKK